jgi:DNA primase
VSRLRPHSASLKRSLEDQTAAAERNLESALPYLLERGIDRASAERFRLGVVNDPSSEYYGRLTIPHIGPADNVYNLRYRTMSDQTPKYLGQPGMETRLFNVRAISQAQETICITEGELDAVVLEMCGLSAVGVCGANSWRRHHARMFDGFARIYILGDGDQPGREFARKVYDSLTGGTMVAMPTGMDVTDVYLADGEAGLRKLLGMED